MSFRLICASFALLTALHEQSAMAQEGTGTDVSGSAEIATDYRFRGYSRSEGEPVGQGVLDVTLPAGVRTSVFAGGTGVLTKSNPAFGSVQTQVYAGFEHEVGAFHLTLSIGVQKGPPIGVQKGPPSSSSVTGMTGALFVLVAA